MSALRIEDFPPHLQAQIRAQLEGQEGGAIRASAPPRPDCAADGASTPPPRSEPQRRAEQREEVKRLHLPFRAWLNLNGLLYVTARTDRASTIRAGWPDFTVILPGARTVACEMKWPGQRLRPEQEAVRALLEAAGVPYLVAYSAAEAIGFVRAHLGDPVRKRWI